jgi:hypothetical protein
MFLAVKEVDPSVIYEYSVSVMYGRVKRQERHGE